METTIITWVLSGFGAVLLVFAGAIMRLSTQTTVLQKTVDTLVTKMDLFLKTETDTLKQLSAKAIEALEKINR